MVELAVTMIALVPLLLYTLFLEDLLIYNLDWQEAIVTPAWDALSIDYPTLGQPSEAAARVQGVARRVFCDHTSAYDSYDKQFDCADERHHKALAAHQCWLAGGKQVTCGVNPEVGLVEESYRPRFSRGGLLSCTARLGVQNYFIVQRFLSFGDELTRTTKFSGDVHANASSANSGNAWVFGGQGGSASGGEEEGAPGTAGEEGNDLPQGTTSSDDFFAVLHDSWALNHLVTILPDDPHPWQGHPLYDRVEHYYYSGRIVASAQPAVDAADAFGNRLVQLRALSQSATTDESASAAGDRALRPNVAFIASDPNIPTYGRVGDPPHARGFANGQCGNASCPGDAPPPPPPPQQVGSGGGGGGGNTPGTQPGNPTPAIPPAGAAQPGTLNSTSGTNTLAAIAAPLFPAGVPLPISVKIPP